MKLRHKSALKLLICLLGAPAALYSGRVLAYFIMSRIFAGANMSQATCAAAPYWLRFVWDRTVEIANVSALLSCIGALLYLRELFPREKTAFMPRWLLLGACGAFASALMVKLLIDTGSLRAGTRSGADILACASDVLLSACCALYIRDCAVNALRASFGSAAAYIFSALAQAAVFALLTGGLKPLALINGLALGIFLAWLYIKRASPLLEILLMAGFRIGARRVMGFPDAGVFAVSENIFSGGDAGLMGSLFAAVVMALGALMYLLFKWRKRPNGQ